MDCGEWSTDAEILKNRYRKSTVETKSQGDGGNAWWKLTNYKKNPRTSRFTKRKWRAKKSHCWIVSRKRRFEENDKRCSMKM